jgi:GT2 family glycosyltransferase
MTNEEFSPRDMRPDVSVLIVNFNGMQFLDNCLNSLKTAFVRHTYETIIIDNASSDGSQAFLRERKDIRYIESPDNLGFTGGNNRAASIARGNVLLLLNNDTCISSNLDTLIDIALDEDVGAVGCRLVYGDGRLQFSVGLDHSPLRIVLSWLGLEKRHRLPSLFRRTQTDPVFYGASHPNVDWVSGACLATRRDVWNRLEGLDEKFFMYCEDVDYCLRVRKMGKRVAYHADAIVIHFEGAGKTWVGGMALKRTVHSYHVFIQKHFGSVYVKAVALALGCVFLMRSFSFRCAGLLTRGKEKKALFFDKSVCYRKAALLFLIDVFSNTK